MNRSRNAGRFLLVVGVLLVAGVVGEVALRLAFARLPLAFLVYVHPALRSGNTNVEDVLHRRLPFFKRRREDKDVGWTFEPDEHIAGTNEDGEGYDVTASTEGFLTPSVPDPSTPQLITLGDSFLSTFYVKEPLAWTLQRDLHVPVYNLAAGGWGPESYRAAYLKFAAGRAHRRVVVFTFFNDITDVLNWTSWKNDETYGDSFLTWMQRTTSSQPVNGGDGWMDRHVVLWNYVKFVAASRGSAARGERAISNGPAAPEPGTDTSTASGGETSSSRNARASFQFTGDYAFLQLDPASFEPGANYYQFLQQYFESLARLKQAIASHGAQMVLVWIPSKERVYVPLLPRDRFVHYVTNRSGDISGMERAMAAYTAQSGTAFLDLTHTLEEHARAGEQLYFSVDGHLNSAGNALAGHAVAEFLRSLPVTDPAPVNTTPHLIYRTVAPRIVERLQSGDVTYRARIVSVTTHGWRVSGRAEGAATYILQWPERRVSTPSFLVARGTVHRGGVSVGLLEHDKWALQNSVPKGRFDLAIPVIKSSTYSVVIANDLPGSSLSNDVDIDEIGWAPVE